MGGRSWHGGTPLPGMHAWVVEGQGHGECAVTKATHDIPGTQLIEVGGQLVRLVTASGKCFAPTDFAGALGHLEKLARKRSTHEAARLKEDELASSSSLVVGNCEVCEVKVASEDLEAQRKRFAERHAEMIESEERVLVSQASHVGEVVQRGRANAWVRPLNPELIPESVRVQLRAMNDDFRAKSSEAEGKTKPFCGVDADVVYVRIADVKPGLVMKRGVRVKFKLYTDLKGVGGCEVVAAT